MRYINKSVWVYHCVHTKKKKNIRHDWNISTLQTFILLINTFETHTLLAYINEYVRRISSKSVTHTRDLFQKRFHPLQRSLRSRQLEKSFSWVLLKSLLTVQWKTASKSFAAVLCSTFTSGLIGRAMPFDRDSPHHASYKDAHHIRGSISQGSML